MRSQQEIVVLRYVPTSLSIFPCSCLIDLDSLIASLRFVGKTHLAFRSRTRRFCDEQTRQQAIMIGNSITDIHTARATGIPVSAVEFGYSESPITQFDPDGTISHFSQLPATIAAVFSAI
jgi:phosphoglycolate phosphatase-like HAD superfamily hydrolase